MLTDAEAAELAALRRRAYSADADIGGDAPALARLAVLEERARADRAASAPEVSEPAPEPQPQPQPQPQPREFAPAQPPAAADHVAAATAQPPPAAGAPGRRTPRRWLIGGGVVAVGLTAVVLAALAATGILPPQPAASRSAGSVPGAGAITCEMGVSAEPTIPPGADPVRSPQWDAEPPSGSGTFTIIPDAAPPWRGLLTPVEVAGGITALVRVADPATARLTLFPDMSAESGGPTPDQLIASSRRTVALPECATTNTYPLIVISEQAACVHLWVTVVDGPSYPATVAVGDATCG